LNEIIFIGEGVSENVNVNAISQRRPISTGKSDALIVIQDSYPRPRSGNCGRHDKRESFRSTLDRLCLNVARYRKITVIRKTSMIQIIMVYVSLSKGYWR
jgi:hypothetical protein